VFTFYLPKHQQVITYPIAGFDDDLTPGKRRFNFIWYRVADAARLREMNVDANGVQHEYSVPPPLIRKDLIAEMHKDAREMLPPPLLDAVIKIRQPFITPIYDFTSPPIVFGRVAMWVTRRPMHGRIWASGWQKRRPMRRRWRNTSTHTMTSIRRYRPTTPNDNRSATRLYCTAASSAAISVSISGLSKIDACTTCCKPMEPCSTGSRYPIFSTRIDERPAKTGLRAQHAPDQAQAEQHASFK
jgi:hypothetical protein